MALAVTLALAGSVGLFATAHFAIFLRLLKLLPLGRALLALLLAPLAPYWGYKVGLRLLPLLWAITLAMYALALGLAS